MFKIGDKVKILKEDCGLDIDIKNETGIIVGYDSMSYLLKLDNPPAPTFSIALDYVSDKADLLFVDKASIKLMGRNGIEIGDKVEIITDKYYIAEKGDVVTVTGMESDYCYVVQENESFFGYGVWLEIKDVVKLSEQQHGQEFEIGDKVKIVVNEDGEIVSYVGLIGEVTAIDLDDNTCYIKADDILGTWVDMDNVVKIETVEEKAKVEEIEFEIGDKVRIKGLDNGFDVAHDIDGQTGVVVAHDIDDDYVVKLDDPVLPTYDYCCYSGYRSDKKDLYNVELSQLELIGRNGIEIGDEVKIVTNEGDLTRISGAPGWFGVVVKVDFDDTCRIKRYNAENKFWVNMEDIVKLEEIGNFEESNFKIGDRVRIIKPGLVLDFENETGTVVGYDDDSGANLLKLDNPPVPTFSSAFDYTSDRKDLLFAHSEDIRLIGRDGIEVGDEIKVVTNEGIYTSFMDIPVGWTGVVMELDTVGVCSVRNWDTGVGTFVNISDVVKIDEINKLEEIEFEIGDKVKVVTNKGDYTSAPIGWTGVVTEIDSDDTCTVRDYTGICTWVDIDNVTKIDEIGETEETIFEVGDMVKVVTYEHGEGLTFYEDVGLIGRITIIDLDDNTCFIEKADDIFDAYSSTWVDIDNVTKIDEIGESEEFEFDVGDIIVANEYSDSEYNITNKQKGCVALVIKNHDWDEIKIRIIGHDDKNEIGEEFYVEMDYFDKIELDFEVGDRVEVVSERGEITYGNAIVGFEGIITEIDLSDYTCYIEGDSNETWVDMFDLEKIEFQVGDILEANYQSNDVYGITNEMNNCTVKVLNVFSDGEIEVVIIGYRNTEKVGTKWYVDSKYFCRVEVREEFEEGDLVIAESFVDCDDILSNSNKCVGRIIERKTKDFFVNHENIEVVNHINPDIIGETFFVPRTHIRKAHPEILVFDDNIMKTGRVAVTRNGMRWLVIRDVDHIYTGNQTWALLSEKGEFMSSDSYDDQARTGLFDDYDIMQVLQYDADDNNLLQSSFFDLDSRDYVVWDRGGNGFIC